MAKFGTHSNHMVIVDKVKAGFQICFEQEMR